MMNPAMVQSMLSSLRNMDEPSLRQFFMNSGMCRTEEQAAGMAAQVKKLSPGMVKFLSSAAGVVGTGTVAAQRARAFLASHQMLAIALAVLLVAVVLRWLGVM
jgi:hypothetical protein